jgi:hypothetical protein
VALTTDDVNAVVAQWEEWTADAGFALSIEVRDDCPDAVMVGEDAIGLGARLPSSLYCQVQIRRGEVLVFDERLPYDREALQASVSVLARTIAAKLDGGELPAGVGVGSGG